MEATELPATTTNVRYEVPARSLPAAGKEPMVLPPRIIPLGTSLDEPGLYGPTVATSVPTRQL